ncbi:hypothetical protein [Rahnella sp. PCH160]|uniref:hypothetical protein n=1 Tax=Rahnella sp. PCH160 TaxID=3447928 RepID=UPI0039FC0E6E
MTDTTDIKALLGNLKFYAGEASCHPDPNYYLEFEKLCTPTNILTVIGVLEAERQRADKAQTDMQFECDAHIETAESWREWKLRAVTAEAELAALKAKLANPVVLPPRKNASYYVDEEFTNADLAAIYNTARLELSVKIQNSGFTVKGE